MPRKVASVDDLVSSVIRISKADLNPSGKIAYISDVGKTDLGRQLSKVAQLLREEALRPLSWDDVMEARGTDGR